MSTVSPAERSTAGGAASSKVILPSEINAPSLVSQLILPAATTPDNHLANSSLLPIPLFFSPSPRVAKNLRCQ